MIPIVQTWARNCKLPVSQLFIPLSFASILGGTVTLIGTSTNLVVAGLSKERYSSDAGECITPDGTNKSQERASVVLVLELTLSQIFVVIIILKLDR